MNRDSQGQSEVTTIDLTPTWGEYGNVVWRFAMSGESRVLRELKKEFAKAFASAEAVKRLHATLTPEQLETLNQVMAEEMVKQGCT